MDSYAFSCAFVDDIFTDCHERMESLSLGRAPKRKNRIPTIHFPGLLLLISRFSGPGIIYFSNQKAVYKWYISGTLQGTNISHQKSLLKMILKMIFLFPRWDMLIPWRVYTANWGIMTATYLPPILRGNQKQQSAQQSQRSKVWKQFRVQ